MGRPGKIATVAAGRGRKSEVNIGDRLHSCRTVLRSTAVGPGRNLVRTWNEEEGEGGKLGEQGQRLLILRYPHGIDERKVEKGNGDRETRKQLSRPPRSGTCAQSDQDCVFSGFKVGDYKVLLDLNCACNS